jgi:hypothetical protein
MADWGAFLDVGMTPGSSGRIGGGTAGCVTASGICTFVTWSAWLCPEPLS